VAAPFVAELVAGGTPLGPEVGRVVRLDFHTRESGWLLDDLHLTFESAGRSRCLAASIKSHRRVMRTGFPEDFVRALWEQWLRTGAGCFREDRDLLGLITGQLAGSVTIASSPPRERGLVLSWPAGKRSAKFWPRNSNPP